MSTVIRCDGPDCDITVGNDSGASVTWLTARRGLANLDFHAPECLAAWATNQPGSSTTVVDGR